MAMAHIHKNQFGKDEYCEGRWWETPRGTKSRFPRGAPRPFKRSLFCHCCKGRFPIKDFHQIDTRYWHTQYTGGANKSECKYCCGKHPDTTVSFLS